MYRMAWTTLHADLKQNKNLVERFICCWHVVIIVALNFVLLREDVQDA